MEGQHGTFVDNRPQSASQRKLADMVANSPRLTAQRAMRASVEGGPRMMAQRALASSIGSGVLHSKPNAISQRVENTTPAPNRTGLPDQLKSGVESLSGMSMDHVKVHYNSAQPAQLNALAYAQGSDIHVAPGQEKHVPHEAWHVVQQAQGRVQPTRQMRTETPINDNPGLEHEADVMGAKAATVGYSVKGPIQRQYAVAGAIQPIQRLVAPPAAPPANGTRGRTLNGAGVPTESHITTPIGGNDLVGTAPGVIINGWPYIQGVGATGPWVRFHLINQQIGGLGDQNNLVPTSHATNHDAGWRAFEVACQGQDALNRSIHVSVDVGYPAAAVGPIAGTLAASQHFYPNAIDAECHRWNANTGAWVQVSTANVVPFPLQPPAAAGHTDLTQQTSGWLRNTLLGGNITAGQATTLKSAFDGNYMGDDIPAYVGHSNEPTVEMRLLDAIESFVAVELQVNVQLPAVSRVNIFNGVYHI